jgi:hypothetical protein
MRSDIKTGIISSVVASFLFIYFLDPILAGVGRVARIGTTAAYQSFLDGLFAQMATGVSAKLPLFLLSIPLGFEFSISITIIIAGMRLLLRNREKRTTGLAKDDGQTEPRAKKRGIVPTSRAVRRSFLLQASLLLVALFGLYATLSLWSYWYSLKITTSFRQHIEVLAPCLSELERREFESAWASMQSEADYRAIYLNLEVAARRCHKRLPPNRLFGLGSVL